VVEGPTHCPDAAAVAAGSPSARQMVELYDFEVLQHMLPFGKHFTNYCSILPHAITTTDKHIFYAVGMRDLTIEVPNGESSTPVTLKDMLHAPDMGVIIVSINCIIKARHWVLFSENTCTIKTKKNKVIGTIPASAMGLYKVE